MIVYKKYDIMQISGYFFSFNFFFFCFSLAFLVGIAIFMGFNMSIIYLLLLRYNGHYQY